MCETARLTKCLDSLSLIVLFHQTNRVSSLAIHVSTSYYQLPTKFI